MGMGKQYSWAFPGLFKNKKFFINLFFCVFKVFQCTALGAALDNCLCCFFCQKSILPTDSITIVNVRL